MKENEKKRKQTAPAFPTNILHIPSLPRILVTRSSLPPFEEYVEEIRDIWESHWLTNMGMKHQELQKELCAYLDVENIDLLTNGHMALELSLQALDLSGEVITTPFTFVSTTHAIVRNGLTPVFCDVKADDYTIDESKLEALITEKTCAIVPVHVYGNICNVEQIQKIADKYGLKVIYDAAHAFGETWKGHGIGSFGDVSSFSFHATKVFNTIEGGAVCFRDPEFGYTIARLKNFGIRGPEIVDGIGANAKMNEFCAAMGLCNLRHVDQEIARRKAVAQQYREALSGVPGLTLNREQENVRNNYAYFPVVFDEGVFGADRNRVFNTLLEHGINARKYFYPLTNAMDCYQGRFDPGETPVAQYLADRVLTLPFYPDLDRETVERICEIILSCRRTY
ncbi:MAG: DegT/DnrJ/EryC1/StrS family aminotransferase [Oscillospiraceae bacterium]|nr:DegT/DnrJ/EryC1/StrS family aminotransferase [Oscillospiraceae bacterium]